uniref:Apolipoprot-like protein n=1 Tax=Tritia obsoleta TaxID=1934733 RepID=A0A8F4YKH0_9CAEN|nr:apolipoprot-like protein [Tritia obsoleta]
MRVGKYVNRVRAWVTTYIPSPRHSLWTAINTYLPSTDTDTWLPPFTGHAFVMGDQHMVTFDRRHYNFAGRCSYVLARDMGDDRFTVILHYNNRPRQPQVQSVVVLLRGVAIEVDRENKVKVNDKGTELPFFSGVISAVRHHSIVRVQDGQALTVEIDSARGIYSVAISGWYHGRTAGLLGTYDNEPFNDLTDSNHQITEDVEAFTNSWEVGRRYCRSRNLADVEEMDEEDGVVTECRKFLTDSSSYFSPCFGQVDAEELVWTCVSHARTAGVSVQEAQCRAGQHYRYMCGRLGIAVSTPSQCVTCQLPHDQGSFSAGVSKEVEARVDDLGADVVFVVEESSCNSWAQRSLASLATQLAQALTAKGLTDNRFGMVSYAGNGSQDLQLVHTIEGQVFGDPGNFLKAAENLRLTYPSQRGDVEAALQKAAQYPFRAGVAKVLVLLPCSACSGDLYVLGQVLSSYGFQLHVINEQNFALGGDDSDGADDDKGGVRIYGVDSSKAHTQKSAARRAAEIYGKLSPPEGSCARLALATNGSVFDSAHMQARGRIQRDFLESFAARGALGARTPDCERCSCHDDGTGRGHLVCQLCDHDHAWMWNHIPRWLQSSSTSVMGVFNDLHHQLVTSLEVPEVVQGA